MQTLDRRTQRQQDLDYIVRKYGVDYALGLLAQGVIEDGFTDGSLLITGITGFCSTDPLVVFGEDPILKQFPLSELPDTLGRWESLGRTITTARWV